MEIIYILLAAIVLFFIFSRLLGKGVNTISTHELKALMKDKATSRFYVDVRTPGEFKTNKIKGFKNIPLDKLSTRLAEIPKDKPVIVICQSGSRSSAACRQLTKAGYTDITNVQGGMNMWR